MGVEDFIVKFLPKSAKNNPEVIAFIDRYAAKAIFGVGVTGVVAGAVWLVKGAQKDSHIIGDMSEAITSYKAELIDASYSDEAREVYIKRRNTVVKTTVGRLLRAYGPGVTLIFVGEVLQGVAFGSVNGKLASTAAALTGATAFIDQISKRTESKFGKKIRDEIFYGGHTVDDLIAEIDGDGKPAVKKSDHLVLDDDFAPARWTFDYQDSALFRPNDPMYNPDLLEYWNDRFKTELQARVRNGGFGYITVNEILQMMRFKHVKDIPEITRLTWGVIANEFDTKEDILTWRKVDLPSQTTDGQRYVEQTYLIEIQNVVYLPDYLKNK